MANTEEDDPFTPEELAALRRRIAMLAPSNVEAVYRAAYEDCAPLRGRLARAKAIQELVTAWKQFRKWARR